ncbi:MAG: YdbH domain-containing protein [Proteobacteria bacterium]|nr:YdbH domain-containing protein [Pseudomonadota bacterium]MBU1417519.1 YdbH domain-containing protein [Pseudomonadota bacterium]MBU1456208.1 YdbH domain-containing protein [Pseudomonadota bacterium]
MRFFSILTAFLAISLSLLFFNRLTIIEKLLIHRMEALGGQKVQVTVSKLNSSELTVDILDAEFQKTSPVQHTELRNVILHYSLSELLKGEIAKMSVDSVEIELSKPQKKPQSTTFSSQTVQTLLEHNLFPAFLPKNISIHNLSISDHQTISLTGLSLQLVTQTLDSTLSATILIPEKNISIDAVLTRLTNGATMLQLDGHQATLQLFHLNLQQKHAETNGNLTTRLDTLNILSSLLPFSLPDISGNLELQFSARNTVKNSLEMEMVIEGQGLSLSGLDIDSLTGKVALHADNLKTLTFHRGSHIYISDIQSPVACLKKLYFQFSGNLTRELKQLTFSLSHDSRLLLEDFTRESLHVEYTEITPALHIIHSTQGTTLVLLPEFTAAIKELHDDKLSIPGLSLSPEKDIALTRLTDNSTSSWTITGGQIISDINVIQVQDLYVRPTRIVLEIQDSKNTPAPLQFLGLIHNKAMAVQWKDNIIPLRDIQVDLAMEDSDLQLSVGFSHAVIPGRIAGNASHSFQDSTGKAQFSTVQPLNLQNENSKTNKLDTGLQLPFSIRSGLVDSTVNMQWFKKDPLVINSRFQLTDGIGVYNNVTFSGVKIEQDLQLVPQLRTLDIGHIFIREIDSGFKIENIVISNQLNEAAEGNIPLLLVDSIEAELLGGRVASKGLRFDPSHPEMDIILQVNGVNLEEVININKIKNLSVTGLLDGDISIHTQGRKIESAKGELQSRTPGGIINYQPAGENNALRQLPAYAIHALEEFHYTQLTATPLYESDGTLTINIHTEGQSPRVNTNRPIHLNLNTSQNILSLLQSLRYSKKLTDDLEKRLQNYQPKN